MTGDRTAGDTASDRTLPVEALLAILAQIDPASPFHEHAARVLDTRLIRDQW